MRVSPKIRDSRHLTVHVPFFRHVTEQCSASTTAITDAATCEYAAKTQGWEHDRNAEGGGTSRWGLQIYDDSWRKQKQFQYTDAGVPDASWIRCGLNGCGNHSEWFVPGCFRFTHKTSIFYLFNNKTAPTKQTWYNKRNFPILADSAIPNAEPICIAGGAPAAVAAAVAAGGPRGAVAGASALALANEIAYFAT